MNSRKRWKIPRLLSRGLRVEALTTDTLTNSEREELFEIYKTSVLNCSREFFDRKFSSVDYLFLIQCEDGRVNGVCGFSLVKGKFEKGKFVAICPSNTLLAPSLRGKSIVEWFGVLGVIFTRLRYPFRHLYCAYLGSTIPIYLVMAKNYPIFWPHPNTTIPNYAREVMTQCAEEVLIGDVFDWDPDTWLVTYDGNHDRDALKVNQPTGKYSEYVEFYQNTVGEKFGVLCLTPMNISNLRGIVKKSLERTFKPRQKSQRLPHKI